MASYQTIQEYNKSQNIRTWHRQYREEIQREGEKSRWGARDANLTSRRQKSLLSGHVYQYRGGWDPKTGEAFSDVSRATLPPWGRRWLYKRGLLAPRPQSRRQQHAQATAKASARREAVMTTSTGNKLSRRQTCHQQVAIYGQLNINGRLSTNKLVNKLVTKQAKSQRNVLHVITTDTSEFNTNREL